VESKWQELKDCINTSLQSTLPKSKKTKSSSWMTDEILNMMEERKKAALSDKSEYRRLHRRITGACRKAKDVWLKTQCNEIVRLEKNYEVKKMHMKIREMTGSSRKREEGCIRDKDGNVLFDKEDVLERWTEYVEELYKDERGDMPMFDPDDSGEEIMKGEVEKAIIGMKAGKAVGPDEIPAEALKAMDSVNIEHLTSLCNRIYLSGYIPVEMRNSVFIPIAKKVKAQHCSDYRAISLMSHVTKLILKIIQQRISNRVEAEISRLQSGFRAGTGTREGIFHLRILTERALQVNREVFACFIDYSKAFDCIKHEQLIHILKAIGVDDRDLKIITGLYWQQKGCVRTGHGLSREFQIKRGVRQGCVLSPSLFNLYVEQIFRAVEDKKGIVVGGININNLRYADDTVLISDSEQNLQVLLNAVNEEGEKWGMKINVAKTKTMVIHKRGVTPNNNLNLNGNALQQVSSFVYLGHLITEDGRCEREIRRRIEIARVAFEKMANVLTSRSIHITTRLKIAQCYIWSTLLYASETWTLSSVVTNRINAFEMWIYRRILKLSWRDRITNTEVLRRMRTERSLMNNIKKRKMEYFGHIIRKGALQREILDGKIDGKRGRGRPRQSWTGNIKMWTGMEYWECVRGAQERQRWRSMVADLLRAEDTNR
jgi:hypothetical protein